MVHYLTLSKRWNMSKIWKRPPRQMVPGLFVHIFHLHLNVCTISVGVQKHFYLKCQRSRISPVCLSIWVCESYVEHHLNGTELHCAPSTCIVHHRPASCTMVHKGGLHFWEVGVTQNIFHFLVVHMEHAENRRVLCLVLYALSQLYCLTYRHKIGHFCPKLVSKTWICQKLGVYSLFLLKIRGLLYITSEKGGLSYISQAQKQGSFVHLLHTHLF